MQSPAYCSFSSHCIETQTQTEKYLFILNSVYIEKQTVDRNVNILNQRNLDLECIFYNIKRLQNTSYNVEYTTEMLF